MPDTFCQKFPQPLRWSGKLPSVAAHQFGLRAGGPRTAAMHHEVQSSRLLRVPHPLRAAKGGLVAHICRS